MEIYSDWRKAEFLLNNAVTEEDYQLALQEVRALGIDPDEIPQRRPSASARDERGRHGSRVP